MVPPGRLTQLDLAVVGAMFSDGLRGSFMGRSTTCCESRVPTAAGTTSCPSATRSWRSATAST